MAGEYHVHAPVSEQRQDVAGIEELVALTPGTRDRNEVVVEYENAQVGLVGEAVLEEAVAVAAYRPLTKVGGPSPAPLARSIGQVSFPMLLVAR